MSGSSAHRHTRWLQITGLDITLPHRYPADMVRHKGRQHAALSIADRPSGRPALTRHAMSTVSAAEYAVGTPRIRTFDRMAVPKRLLAINARRRILD
ncbi:hypothetical protein ACQP0C_21865 [Nocardia sp. CA-129566]|uniref:hypothetical protein n=1 Tax=Nocardia sp. CA-129566 TaxID=3239976 RepID=UPI003D9957E6